MGADATATYAGQPVTDEDGKSINGMDGYTVTTGDVTALLAFDEDEMRLVLQ